MARRAFYFFRKREHFSDRRILAGKLKQFRLHFFRFPYRHGRPLCAQGDEFRNGIAACVGEPKGARYVPHGCAREHGAKSDDARDARSAILCSHVFNNFVAPRVFKVDVNIRRRRPFGIQKALERKLVIKGIERGDAERICHERACGRTARGGNDVPLPGEADKIGNHQKIHGVSLFLNNIKFVVQAVARFLGDAGNPFVQPFFGKRGKVGIRVLIRGKRELGEVPLAEGKRDMATFGDQRGIFYGIRQVGEPFFHGGALGKREVYPPHIKAFFFCHGSSRADAHQGVMGVSVIWFKIMDICSRHQRQIKLTGECHQSAIDAFLLFALFRIHERIPLDFNIKIAGPQYLAILLRRFPGARFPPLS